jgi:lysozyme
VTKTKPNATLEASPICLALIKRWEGYETEVYLDPVGLPTGGVGHLLTPSELLRFPVGTDLSEAQIDAWLRSDIWAAQGCVRLHVDWDLDQAQFDALVSFVFNVGCEAFRRSTLLRLLNAGLEELAAEEFDRWVFAKGRKLQGLVARRAAERDVFLSMTEKEPGPRPWPKSKKETKA